MQRRFTQDVGKNFKEGQIEDFPFTTWTTICRNGRFKDLEDFSIAVGVDEQPTTKSPVPKKEKKKLFRKNRG